MPESSEEKESSFGYTLKKGVMMKIQIISDIHLNHHRDGGDEFLANLPKAADTLIVAGDIGESNTLVENVKSISRKWNQVIFVLGNHDFYRSSISATKNLIKANLPSNSILLDNNTVELNGVRFVGGTLWFENNRYVMKYAHNINDFRLVSNINEVFDENRKFLDLLKDVNEDDVVISHHLPHEKSVNERYKGDELNVYFLCDVKLERLSGPKLWIHGHTHSACDYMVKNTRVVCNPFGYPTERNDFQESLVIEV